MFQNYMDYSNDVCMNLFTEGQKSRMRALFEPGGAREPLLSSVRCGGTITTPLELSGIQNTDTTYTTTNTITANATITTGANISYISGTQITLSPGFTVQAGATFSASISSSNAKEPAKETPALPFTTWDQPKHHTQSTDFKIYPNPIRPQEEFFLEYSARAGERIGASIHTLEGRRIATLFNEYEITTGIAKRSLTLQNVPPGIYIVRLVSSQGIQTQKFVVQ
jgi:hypothetical protein